MPTPIDIGDVLTRVMPFINLALVAVVVFLFVRLFRRDAHDHIYSTPWKLLFAAVCVYIIEQVLTVLRHAGIVSYNHLLLNGLFELVIVILFVYTLLLQKEHVKKSGF